MPSQSAPWICVFLLAVAGAWSIIGTRADSPRWLIGPITDILLTCGGLVWLVFAVTLISNSSFPAMADGGASQNLLLIAGALFLTDTHFGIGFTHSFKRHFRDWFWCPIIIISITAAFLGLSESITIWSCKIYLFIIVLHYAQQSLTLLLRYARINNSRWEQGDKLALSLLVYTVAARCIVSQLVLPSLNVDSFLGLQMPSVPPLPSFFLLGADASLFAMSLVVAFTICKRALAGDNACPLPFCLLLCNVLLIFSYLQFSAFIWIFVPAFFHATQSIAEALHRNGERVQKDRPVLMLFSSFVVGLIVMWVVPKVLVALGVSGNLAYPAVVIAASLWHFLCDYMMSLETP